MKQFNHPKFKKEPVVVIIIETDELTTIQKPAVNGTRFEIPNNEPVSVPQCFYDTLVEAGAPVRLVEAEGDGDGDDGGVEAEQASAPVNSFDPDSILDQNAKTVAAAIKENGYSKEQLEALKAAEEGEDGKKREGVTKAIAAALAE